MNNSKEFYEGVKACEAWIKQRRETNEGYEDAVYRLCPHDITSQAGEDWHDGFAAQLELWDVEEHVDTTQLSLAEVDEFTARLPASAFDDDLDTHL